MAKKELAKIEDKELDIDSIKLEVFEFAKAQVNIEIDKEVKKANERYIKDRNRKILSQKIIIALLVISYLITIGFLIHDHYFDKYLTKNEVIDIDDNDKTGKKEEDEKGKETNKDSEEQDKIDEEEQKRKELLEKYSNIFDGYKLTLGNEYLNSEDINKFVISYTIDNIPSDQFTVDEDTFLLNEEVLATKAKELFNYDIEHESFSYNGINFKYYKKLSYYMLDKEFVANDIEILRKMIDIKEDNDVEVITKDYYVKEDKVYTIDDNYVCELKEVDSNLDKIPSKTNIFIKKDDGYYLKIK